MFNNVLTLCILLCSAVAERETSRYPGQVNARRQSQKVRRASTTNRLLLQASAFQTAQNGSQPSYNSSGSSVESELRDHLLAGYDKSVWPWVAMGGPVQVNMSLAVQKIVSVDLVQTQMQLMVWWRLFWVDPRLQWDPEAWAGVRQMFFSPTYQDDSIEIWQPEVTLWNEVERSTDTIHNHPVQVTPDGIVRWSRNGVVSAGCNLGGMKGFPYTKLSCLLEFGDWTYSPRYVQLYPSPTDNVMPGITMGGSETSLESVTSDTYVLTSVTCQRHLYPAYECCPDDSYWPVLFYQFEFRHAQLLYTVKVVLSQALLTLVAFAAFWLNPACGERIGLAITVPLAAAVYDLLVFQSLPNNDTMSFISTFGLLSFITMMLATLETVIVIQLHYFEEPTWSGVFSMLHTLLAYREQRDWIKLLVYLDKRMSVHQKYAERTDRSWAMSWTPAKERISNFVHGHHYGGMHSKQCNGDAIPDGKQLAKGPSDSLKEPTEPVVIQFGDQEPDAKAGVCKHFKVDQPMESTQHPAVRKSLAEDPRWRPQPTEHPSRTRVTFQDNDLDIRVVSGCDAAAQSDSTLLDATAVHVPLFPEAQNRDNGSGHLSQDCTSAQSSQQDAHSIARVLEGSAVFVRPAEHSAVDGLEATAQQQADVDVAVRSLAPSAVRDGEEQAWDGGNGAQSSLQGSSHASEHRQDAGKASPPPPDTQGSALQAQTGTESTGDSSVSTTTLRRRSSAQRRGSALSKGAARSSKSLGGRNDGKMARESMVTSSPSYLFLQGMGRKSPAAVPLWKQPGAGEQLDSFLTTCSRTQLRQLLQDILDDDSGDMKPLQRAVKRSLQRFDMEHLVTRLLTILTGAGGATVRLGDMDDLEWAASAGPDPRNFRDNVRPEYNRRWRLLSKIIDYVSRFAFIIGYSIALLIICLTQLT